MSIKLKLFMSTKLTLLQSTVQLVQGKVCVSFKINGRAHVDYIVPIVFYILLTINL